MRRLGFLVLVALAACGGGGDDDDAGGLTGGDRGSDDDSGEQSSGGDVGDGPVTLVTLGDSLTSGEGDELGLGGFPGRLGEAIGEGTEVVNLGQSGWDSTQIADEQLPLALDAIAAAGGPVIATVLAGSNDQWYVYDATAETDTTDDEEDAVVDLYRANLDRIVGELTDAGAVVFVGLPDEQSLRPGVADIDNLHLYLPNITEAEVERMGELSHRLADVAEEVADDHGAVAVPTDDEAWTDRATVADDGVHPNAAGYDVFTDIWFEAIEPLL